MYEQKTLDAATVSLIVLLNKKIWVKSLRVTICQRHACLIAITNVYYEKDKPK